MQYELTADRLRFLLVINHNGAKRDIIATMKPYEAGSLIALLKEREASFETSKTDLDALEIKAPGAREANVEFFDRHKISLTVGGQEASDKILERIDAQYKIKSMVIALGYLGVKDENPDEADAEQTPVTDLEAEFGDDVTEPQSFLMADESGIEQKILIAHRLRRPTAEDRIRWDRAQKVQSVKGGGHRTRYAHEGIGHLYDAMIREASGFLIAGQACLESNKPDWVKLIPYIFKFRAIDSLFQLAQQKNG